MVRSVFGFAVFLIGIGVVFTLMAPGGLGEPTIVLGVVFALTAVLPETWMNPMRDRRIGIAALVMGEQVAQGPLCVLCQNVE